ncbi:MAG TPA: DUF433 domain-containing protein [Polyangiaceae bacterium]|jgi:uncharacterized protein (DUF433 family)|nr:DUF433 domain-containing protein [Polyangiaceae bacterium]
MATAQTLSATEVAALAGLDEGRVRKDVENGIFPRPTFMFADLVYFFAVALLGVQLGVDDRRKLHALIAAAMAARRPPPRVEFGPVLEVRLDRVTKDAEEKLARFDAWKKKLVTDERILGGETVFPKSRLAVRHVGEMLLRGAAVDDVREDYPDLKDEDIEFSTIFTRAYPRMGRPRERQTASR